MSYFKAKMYQILFRLGLCPRPHWGSLQHSPDPLAVFKGPNSKGRGKEEGEEGEGGKGVPDLKVEKVATLLTWQSQRFILGCVLHIFHITKWKNYAFLRPAMHSTTHFHPRSTHNIMH